MDIVSQAPPEVALQILRHLDLTDIVTCQLVCRRWYWLAQDQTVWKYIFWGIERPYALPLKDLVEPFSHPALFASTPSLPPTLVPGHLSANSEERTLFHHQAQPSSNLQQPSVPSSSLSPSPQPFVDWRAKCQQRTQSERHWAQGSIQSASWLRIHRGGIVRLRIKDNKLLSGDMFGQVVLWDLASMKDERCFEAAVGPIQLMDFSAKRMIMTVISRSGVCRIWNLEEKNLIHSEDMSDVACMTMDDWHLIVGDNSGTIRVIDFTTGESLRSTVIQGQVIQDIHIQNNTMIVVTFNDIRIICLETLKTLSHAKLPTSNLVFAYCSVFHIRSLILLIENQLIQMEWDPLYTPLAGSLTSNDSASLVGSPPKNSTAMDHQIMEVTAKMNAASIASRTRTDKISMLEYELPPDLSKPPRMYRTSVPPIATITSIAIGGKHPHVLTTNADYPSLEDTIRICGKPALRSSRRYHQPLRRSTSCSSSSSAASSSPPSYSPPPSTHPFSDAEDSEPNATPATANVNRPLASLANPSEKDVQDTGVVLLHSPVPEVSSFLRQCGLKPSFMDVDEDIVVVGTDKGDIVVLNMLQ